MALYLLQRKRKSILNPLTPTHTLSPLFSWSVGRKSIVFKFLCVQQRQSLPLGRNVPRAMWWSFSFRRVPAAPLRTPGCWSLLSTRIWSVSILLLMFFFFLSLKNIQRDQETFLVPFPLAVPNKVVCSALPHTKLLSCFSLLCSAVYIFINSMNITLCTFQDHLIDSAWTNVFHDN